MNLNVNMTEADLIEQFKDEFKYVLDDSKWERVDDIYRLRFRQIDGIKVGAVVATYSLKYGNFALNIPETDRLRKGKSNGRVDLMVVVAMKEREHCGHVEVGDLYERVLRNKTPRSPRSGDSGEFWTLNLSEIMGRKAPF